MMINCCVALLMLEELIKNMILPDKLLQQLPKTNACDENNIFLLDKLLHNTILMLYNPIKLNLTMHLYHIPQCPCCNQNVPMCVHFCYEMEHRGIFFWYTVGIIRWVYHPTWRTLYWITTYPTEARMASRTNIEHGKILAIAEIHQMRL